MMSRVIQVSWARLMLVLEATHLYLGPMSPLSSLWIVRVFCTAPFSLAM